MARLSTILKEATSGVVTAASSITTANALPSNGNTIGDQKFVESTDTLYVWNGTQWLDVNRQVYLIYTDTTLLPPAPETGTVAFVSENSSLYVYNGTEWVDTNPNTRNFFYILQTNEFTGPITGDVGYTPTRTIQLQSLEANVATNTSTTITLEVRKNNDTLDQFVLTGGQLSLVSDFSNNSVSTSDTIYLDVVSGSGSDLVVRFNYK